MKKILTRDYIINECVKIAEKHSVWEINSNTVSVHFCRPYMFIYQHFEGFNELLTKVIFAGFKCNSEKIIKQVVADGRYIPQEFSGLFSLKLEKKS